MRKLLNKPWFVAILAVVAFVACTMSLMNSRTTDGTMSPAIAFMDPGHDGTGIDESDTPNGGGEPLRVILAEISLSPNSRDPFGSLPRITSPTVEESEPTEAVETVSLSAIWKQEGIILALVNGRILDPGSRLDSFRIESIDAGGIWISHPQGREFLPLGASFSYTRPSGTTPELTLANHDG